MNDQTDSQLLRAYTEHRSELAFAELVRRHVDFVYSAALRMVCDSHLAEDVTQSVFLALVKNATQLTDRPVLSGWLHRTAQNIAAQTVRTDVRRRAREQEAAAMNELLSTHPDASWAHIAPHLDDAMGELSEPDRDALLLRYFEHKSAREMAQTLGVSDEAAQKRVSRAVERLREFFAKRGVTVGTSGLMVVISANAVQAAPVGLAITISTSAAVAGTAAIHASTAIAATKTIAMTTLQKAIIGATLVAAVGTGIYEARQASTLRAQVQSLQLQLAPVSKQIQQLQRERDDARQQLASLRDENDRLNRNSAELLRLRAEVTLLRNEATKQVLAKTASTEDSLLSGEEIRKHLVASLKNYFELNPNAVIPEIQLLFKNQSFETNYVDSIYELAVLLAAQKVKTNYTRWGYFDDKNVKLETDEDYRRAAAELRSYAETGVAPIIRMALKRYVQANNGQFPTSVSELQPYFDKPIDESIMQRYEIQPASQFPHFKLDSGSSVITQRVPIDIEFDHRIIISSERHLVGDIGSFKTQP